MTLCRRVSAVQATTNTMVRNPSSTPSPKTRKTMKGPLPEGAPSKIVSCPKVSSPVMKDETAAATTAAATVVVTVVEGTDKESHLPTVEDEERKKRERERGRKETISYTAIDLACHTALVILLKQQMQT